MMQVGRYHDDSDLEGGERWEEEEEEEGEEAKAKAKMKEGRNDDGRNAVPAQRRRRQTVHVDGGLSSKLEAGRWGGGAGGRTATDTTSSSLSSRTGYYGRPNSTGSSARSASAP
jgi:hypothetical protein